jgi:hypothetical protein
MQRREITSTMIRSIGHDSESSVLEIEFLSGAVWQYHDFSESDWYAFDGAESQGKYYHQNIKGQYREGQVG